MLLALNFLSHSSQAAHIVGGVMYYRCLGNNNYEFTVKIYRDGNPTGPNAAGWFDQRAAFGVYRGTTLVSNFTVNPVPDSIGTLLPVVINDPCVYAPTDAVVYEATYTFTRNLPFVNEGYTVVYQRCCRNNSLDNIVDPGDTGASFYIYLSPAALTICNNSPVFNNFPPIAICNNRPLIFDHSATDSDGHRLTYSFCSPEMGGGPDRTGTGATTFTGVTPNPPSPPNYNPVVFIPPFSTNNPMGGNPQVAIDPLTGLITGTPIRTGQYVVGVCVSEFDASGTLLSVTRRDFQFNVYNCEVLVDAEIAANSVSSAGEQILRACGNNANVTFINQSTRAQNISSYYWEFDIGGGNTASSNLTNPTIQFPGYGIYNGFLVANPGGQCTDTAELVIQVRAELLASFDFSYDSCIAETIPFIDSSRSSQASVRSWSWNFGDGTTSSLQNPGHFYNEPGTYNVRLVATDTFGCQDDTIRTVLWYPAPLLDFYVPDTSVCEPFTYTFTNNSRPITGYSLLWDFGDGTTSNQISPTHTYMRGEYDISFIATSPNGCVTDTLLENYFQVTPSPIADFEYAPSNPTYFAPSITIDDLSLDGTNWYWDFGDGNTSRRREPTHTYQDTGIYVIREVVVHSSGCRDTAYRRVDIEPIYTYFLPNAFTPNGDGTNDGFRGAGYFYAINRFELTIWDRWGEMIFLTNDPTEAWNGRKDNSGPELPSGVYLYQAKVWGARGKTEVLKGVATLVR